VISPTFTSRLLPTVIAVCALLALATPVRWQSWARPLGQLATAVIAPVSHPFAALSRWIAPADDSPAQTERVRELESRLEEAQRELERVRFENRRLVLSLEELNVMAVVNTSPVRQVYAPIFASSSDLSSRIVRARAGRSQGVEVNSIATAAGLQLLGRVVAVDAFTCDILPFNAKSAESINAIIIIKGSDGGLSCRLTPVGNGSLKGPVHDRRDPTNALALVPEVGQLVRLSDGRWPSVAQMMLVGRVVAVESSPDGPLRQIVTVSPTVERIERVAEVVIRTNATSPDVSEKDSPKAGPGVGGPR